MGIIFPYTLLKRVAGFFVLHSGSWWLFINSSVHMLVWSSSFLPDPHHSFLVTRSFFPKSERLCLFGKELHLYPSLNYTWKWYHKILPLPVSFTSLGMNFLFYGWTWHYFLLLYGWEILHCVDVLHCLYYQLQIGTYQEHCQWLDNKGICHLPRQRLNPMLL